MLEDNKHYLFESRLAPIVKQLGLGSINDLCALLRAKRDAEIGHQVVEAMTTNETYFFRDPAHYEAIRTVLLPQLKEERQGHKKVALLVGCVIHWAGSLQPGHASAGEGLQDWNIQILGTDFSSRWWNAPASGNYQQIEVNRGLPAALLVKYFRRSGLDWQLSEPVRRWLASKPLTCAKVCARWALSIWCFAATS